MYFEAGTIKSISHIFLRRFSQNCEKRPLATSCLSDRLSARDNSAHTRRIFMKFDIFLIFKSMSRKFKFHYNLTRITGTLHEYQYIFVVVSRSILLRMRNISGKTCGRNSTHILRSLHFFLKLYCLWDNVERYGTARQATDGKGSRRVSFPCWTPKAIKTHTEFKISTASPRQNLLRELAPVLRYSTLWLALHWNTSTNKNSKFLSPQFHGYK